MFYVVKEVFMYPHIHTLTTYTARHVGVIVSGVIGGILVVVLTAAVVILLYVRQKRIAMKMSQDLLDYPRR